MSHGQHAQANRHPKYSRGGRLMQKLGYRSRRMPLWKLVLELRQQAKRQREDAPQP